MDNLISVTGLAYNKAGNIVVGDYNNARIQVFSPTGQWISKFGKEVLKSTLWCLHHK